MTLRMPTLIRTGSTLLRSFSITPTTSCQLKSESQSIKNGATSYDTRDAYRNFVKNRQDGRANSRMSLTEVLTDLVNAS